MNKLDKEVFFQMLDQLDFERAEEYLRDLPDDELSCFIDEFNHENQNILLVVFTIHMLKKNGDEKWKDAMKTAFSSGFENSDGFEQARDILSRCFD